MIRRDGKRDIYADARLEFSRSVAASADVAIAPDEARTRRPRLHRRRADHGHIVVDRFLRTQPLRRSIPFHRAERSGHKQTACRAQRVAPDEWPTRMRRLLSDQVSMILRRNIDPDPPLAEYGVDSLGALELCTRIESETGVHLASSDIATNLHSRSGGAAVRQAGARRSRLTTTTPRWQLPRGHRRRDRALSLWRHQDGSENWALAPNPVRSCCR
jgi:acyl carrier protein